MINYINGLSQEETKTISKLSNAKELLINVEKEIEYIKDLLRISKELSGVRGMYKMLSPTKSIVFITEYKSDEVIKKFCELHGVSSLVYLFITYDTNEFLYLTRSERDFEDQVRFRAKELGIKSNKNLEDCLVSKELKIIFNKSIPKGLLDLGAVTLECKGRGFTWDICKTSKNSNCITCYLEVSKDVFPDEEYNYDLTVEDLFDSGITGTVFISCEFELLDPSAIQLTLETISGKITTIDLTVD